MYNETAYTLGANRSCIRDLFEYGRQRAAIVGEENVYDYSLGNPSIPSPRAVDDAIRDILADTNSLLVHGYTSAVGDAATRQAIADDLNARYQVTVRAEDLFIGCGAAPELTGSYPGVDKAYAIQAGREVRIMVKPEVVTEDNMILLARDVAKKIEAELEYPGQIKVNVIRETKAVEYAK